MEGSQALSPSAYKPMPFMPVGHGSERERVSNEVYKVIRAIRQHGCWPLFGLRPKFTAQDNYDIPYYYYVICS